MGRTYTREDLYERRVRDTDQAMAGWSALVIATSELYGRSRRFMPSSRLRKTLGRSSRCFRRARYSVQRVEWQRKTCAGSQGTQSLRRQFRTFLSKFVAVGSDEPHHDIRRAQCAQRTCRGGLGGACRIGKSHFALALNDENHRCGWRWATIRFAGSQLRIGQHP